MEQQQQNNQLTKSSRYQGGYLLESVLRMQGLEWTGWLFHNQVSEVHDSCYEPVGGSGKKKYLGTLWQEVDNVWEKASISSRTKREEILAPTLGFPQCQIRVVMFVELFQV